MFLVMEGYAEYTSSSGWICPSLVYRSTAVLAYFTWCSHSPYYISAMPPPSMFVRYNSRMNSNVLIGDRTHAKSLEDGSNIQFLFPQRLPFKPYRIHWLLTPEVLFPFIFSPLPEVFPAPCDHGQQNLSLFPARGNKTGPSNPWVSSTYGSKQNSFCWYWSVLIT